MVSSISNTSNFQIYLTHRWDPNKCYHLGSEWTWQSCQWRVDCSHTPELEFHHWM